MMEALFYGVTFVFGFFIGVLITTGVAVFAIKSGGNR